MARAITLPDGTKVVRVFGRAARFLAGGAFSIVTMMVEIGVEAIMQFEEEQKLQEGYARMKAKRGSGGSVSSLLENQEGMQKFFLLANFYSPSGSNGAPLPTHRAGVDRIFRQLLQTGTQSVISNRRTPCRLKPLLTDHVADGEVGPDLVESHGSKRELIPVTGGPFLEVLLHVAPSPPHGESEAGSPRGALVVDDMGDHL